MMFANVNPSEFIQFLVNLCHLTSCYIKISVIHHDSACNQRRSPKTEFFSMFLLTQVFSESYGHQSLCSIHVIKPTDPNFEHTKYEPDISSSARKKWGVKIASDCRTPCMCITIIFLGPCTNDASREKF